MPSSVSQPGTRSGNVLAIDQGTSGTKALVVSADRGVLGSAEVAIRPVYGEGGLVEQDPYELLASIVEAGTRALAMAGEAVDAVGLANQGETIVAWDPASGEPSGPAVVWQDRRSAALCARLAPSAARLAEISGLTLDPYFAGPKMAWLRETRRDGGVISASEVVTTGDVITTSDAWLVHRLTGAFVTDASTASRTMLLDLDSASWSAEALELFGLGGERLPEVVDSALEAGRVGGVEVFGGAPLTGLLVDQQASLLAEHCVEPGTAKCTYGTGAFLLANVGDRALRSAAGLTTSVAWRLRAHTTYCLDGQVFTVGSAVRWLADLGLVSGAADLDGLAGSVPDAGGVRFVPALAGLGAPWWDDAARGAMVGLALSTTAAHLARALVDGIAAQVAELAAAAEADLGGALTTLRVDGGLTRSALLMQTQADLLQVPVEVFASADATALGVAAAARLGLDPSLAVADALQPWLPAAVYEPRISADAAAERMAAFRAVAARVTSEPLP